jgi:hypothetical protein
MKKIIIYSLFLVSFLFFFVSRAWAASFNLNADVISPGIGSAFNVDIKVNSEDSGVNAFQATLSFPNTVLEVTKLDKTDSIVDFWLQEPAFDNNAGRITFIGGSTSGFSGQALQILRVTFRVKTAGQINLTFTDGAITASDGSGTNVLSKMNGLQLNVVPEQTVSIPTQITPIVREAAPATGLPTKPVLDIPLYPDPAKWYNFSGNFLAKWILPADVTAVAAVLNKSSQTSPTAGNGLFDNELFPALQNGISYLHVRFRNNVGWGPTNHYRLAVDTEPPVSFKIKVEPDPETSDPNPVIRFESADSLSGLLPYEIRLDDQPSQTTTETNFSFSELSPGKHSIRVVARDEAGNETSDLVELNILPLTSPVIVSATADLFIGEGGLKISGTALPNGEINANLKTKSGQIVLAETVKVDQNGNWVLESDFPLKRGNYFLEAVARDERGASSYPVQSVPISVRERPLLILAGLQITAAWFLFGLVLILLIGFGAGFFLVKLAKAQQGRKALIAQRDIVFSFRDIAKYADQILKLYTDGEVTQNEIQEIKFLVGKIKEELDKGHYILKGVEEIVD